MTSDARDGELGWPGGPHEGTGLGWPARDDGGEPADGHPAPPPRS